MKPNEICDAFIALHLVHLSKQSTAFLSTIEKKLPFFINKITYNLNEMSVM